MNPTRHYARERIKLAYNMGRRASVVAPLSLALEGVEAWYVVHLRHGHITEFPPGYTGEDLRWSVIVCGCGERLKRRPNLETEGGQWIGRIVPQGPILTTPGGRGVPSNP